MRLPSSPYFLSPNLTSLSLIPNVLPFPYIFSKRSPPQHLVPPLTHNSHRFVKFFTIFILFLSLLAPEITSHVPPTVLHFLIPSPTRPLACLSPFLPHVHKLFPSPHKFSNAKFYYLMLSKLPVFLVLTPPGMAWRKMDS